MNSYLYLLSWLANEYLNYNPFFIYGGKNPLLHQTEVVSKSLFLIPTRMLIADAIGLGKTITALRTLMVISKYRKLKRVLIAVPSVLVDQWLDEMRSMGININKERQLIDRKLLSFLSKISNRSSELPPNWYIGSMDTLKRPEYMALLVENKWDAIVVDEAHKLGMPSREPNIRWQNLGKLIRDNKEAVVLLLSATPHRGKANDYLSRLALIDPTLLRTTNVGALEKVFDKRGFYRTTHNTILFRRSKDDINKIYEVEDIFKPCNMIAVLIEPNNAERIFLRMLTELATEYLSRYYNYLRETTSWTTGRIQGLVALLRTVLIKRGLSSPKACVTTFTKLIEKRGKYIELIEKGLSPERAEEKVLTELEDLERKLDEILSGDSDKYTSREKMDYETIELDDIFNEVATYFDRFLSEDFREKLKVVKESAEKILKGEVRDSKLETLKRLLRVVLEGSSENLPEEFRDLSSGKVIVFTEFKDTAKYLFKRIQKWAEEEFGDGSIVSLFTSDNRHKIEDIKRWLSERGRKVLITTDVAGEGLNLQYANVLVNYEIAWSPIRLEQRIGRVWRYGQDKVTYVFNLFLADALEKEVADNVFSKLYGMTLSLGKLEPIIGEKVYLSTIRNELFEHAIKEQVPVGGLVPLEVEFKGRKLSLSEMRIIDLIARDARAFVEAFIKALKKLLEEIRRKDIYPTPPSPEAIRRELKHITGFRDTEEALAVARKLISLVAKCLGAQLEEYEDRVIMRFKDGRVVVMHDSNPEKLLEQLLRDVIPQEASQDYTKYFVFKDDSKKLLLLSEAKVVLGNEVRFREPIGILYKLDDIGEFRILRGSELIEELTEVLSLSIPVDEIFGLDDVRDKVNVAIDTAHSTYYAEVLEKGVLKIMKGVQEYENIKAKLGGFKFFKVENPIVKITVPKFTFISIAFLPEVEEALSEEVWEWTEDEAIPIVFNYEGLQGRSATRASGYEHYDVKSTKRDSSGRVIEERFIEVKTKMGRNFNVNLPREEGRVAKEKGDKYWLYLVYGVRTEKPVILAIRNPLKRLPFQKRAYRVEREEYFLRL